MDQNEKVNIRIAVDFFNKYILQVRPIELSIPYLNKEIQKLVSLGIGSKSARTFMKVVMHEKLEEILKIVGSPVNQKLGICMNYNEVAKYKYIVAKNYLLAVLKDKPQEEVSSFVEGCELYQINKEDISCFIESILQ